MATEQLAQTDVIPTKIRIAHLSGRTEWIDLTHESSNAIVTLLKKHFVIEEPKSTFGETWCIHDIIEVSRSKFPQYARLSEAQAGDVIAVIEKEYDPEIGINFEVIETAVQEYLLVKGTRIN